MGGVVDAAYFSELSKIAQGEPGVQSSYVQIPTPPPIPVAPLVGGAAGGMGGAAGTAYLVSKNYPGVMAQLKAEYNAWRKGTTAREIDEAAKELPPEVVRNAKALAAKIRELGIDPSKRTFAVSGTGGTGKTVLTKALARELGIPRLHLDIAPSKMTGKPISEILSHSGMAGQRGVILEQTHALSRLDPSLYDIAIHVERPMEAVKKQILSRGRGAAQLDSYNYDRVGSIIRSGFDTLAGHEHQIAPGLRIKVAPEGQFTNKELVAKLMSRGIKPWGMSREQMLISLVRGKVSAGKPIKYILRKTHLVSGPLKILAGTGLGAAAGVGAAHLLTRPKISPQSV